MGLYLSILSDRDIFLNNEPWALTNILNVPIDLEPNLSYEVALRQMILSN